MKRTYHRTMLRRNLAEAIIKLDIYENNKYTAECEADLGKQTSVEYKGVTSWDIIESGVEAEEIEKVFSDSLDDNHSYLVLHFENGEQATFRNSYVDMFVW